MGAVHIVSPMVCRGTGKSKMGVEFEARVEAPEAVADVTRWRREGRAAGFRQEELFDLPIDIRSININKRGN